MRATQMPGGGRGISSGRVRLPPARRVYRTAAWYDIDRVDDLAPSREQEPERKLLLNYFVPFLVAGYSRHRLLRRQRVDGDQQVSEAVSA